jgi:hypothetical protein
VAVDECGLGSVAVSASQRISGRARCWQSIGRPGGLYCRVVIGRSRPPRPAKRNSPGFLSAASMELSTASRVCSVIPKPDGLAGLLLAHGRSINSMPCEATSSPLKLTTSHPRSLLSMARLNMARSRVRSAICSLMRIGQTCFGRRWLYADQFTFVPGFATCGRADRICEVSPLLQRAIRMRRSIVESIRRISACGPTRRGVHIASDRPVPN